MDKEKIQRRIEELQEDVIEECNGEQINKDSLFLFTDFIEFMDDHIIDSMSITITPDNEIYVNWKGNIKHRTYSMVFGTDRTINFITLPIIDKDLKANNGTKKAIRNVMGLSDLTAL